MSKNKQLVGIQADPLWTLKPASDSTLFIGAELQKRGYSLFFYTPEDLRLTPEGCFVKGKRAQVFYDSFQSSYQVEKEENLPLEEMKVILIRQDPPFTLDYLTSTYFLSTLSKPLILNAPQALQTQGEKLLPFHFPHFMPPTLGVSSWQEEIETFLETHEQVVLKPLYWFGGKYVELLEKQHKEDAIKKIKAALEKHKHLIFQKFISSVPREGDKRIILINGTPRGALGRIPKDGGFVANLAAGGRAVKTVLTEKDLEISHEVGKILTSLGIALAGIDVADGYLLEINITSPTGLIAVHALEGVNLASQFADHIESLLSC